MPFNCRKYSVFSDCEDILRKHNFNLLSQIMDKLSHFCTRMKGSAYKSEQNGVNHIKPPNN